MKIELPWPPSANHYWKRNGSVYFIAAKGLAFRCKVFEICRTFENRFDEKQRLRVFIEAYPPDKRKRDLDNIFKATLDSLQYAKLFYNDNQIDYLCIERREVIKPGKLIVTIEGMEAK